MPRSGLRAALRAAASAQRPPRLRAAAARRARRRRALFANQTFFFCSACGVVLKEEDKAKHVEMITERHRDDPEHMPPLGATGEWPVA